jgi:hypothetical protein
LRERIAHLARLVQRLIERRGGVCDQLLERRRLSEVDHPTRLAQARRQLTCQARLAGSAAANDHRDAAPVDFEQLTQQCKLGLPAEKPTELAARVDHGAIVTRARGLVCETAGVRRVCFWLLILIAFTSFGCVAEMQEEPVVPAPPQPTPIAGPNAYTERQDDKPRDVGTRTSATAGEEITYASQQIHADKPASADISLFGAQGGAAPGPTPAPAPIEVGARPAAQAEMIDIEARVELEVESIPQSVNRIRNLVAQSGGTVVNEVVEDKATSSGAALSLRVPAQRVDQVLADLQRVGKLLSKKVEQKDIGREYHDAQILQRNLEATLRRYEELLAKAQGAPQVLEIERELSRVRTQLDRVKGDMQWLRDRAARATIYVTLSAPSDAVVEPKATLYPGLRATSVIDFSSDGGSRAFLGGGLSLQFTRIFSLDADWLTRARNGDGVDLFIATGGVGLYSDLLGGGRRKFLNPYLGFRAGYARFPGDGTFAIGGVIGVEIYKTDLVILDLEARGLALLGADDGTHGALQPALAIHFAY